MPVSADSILIVEDDADQIYLLAELLRFEGYDVAAVRSAEEGLEALGQRRFAVVLSDHRLPGKTGAEMLAEARDTGLLQGTGALVLTANPKEAELADWRVLQKPIDFEVLLTEIHQATLSALGRAGPAPPRRKAGTVAVELVLYMSSASPASQRARRNLDRALLRYDASHIKLEVVDLSRPDARVDPDDRIAFTPTLVKRTPGPRTWLLGDLRDARALHQLLADADVPPAPQAQHDPQSR